MDTSALPDIDWSLPQLGMDFYGNLTSTSTSAVDAIQQPQPSLVYLSDSVERPPLPDSLPSAINTPVSTVQQSPVELHGEPSEIPDGQPFDSPWVSGGSMTGVLNPYPDYSPISINLVLQMFKSRYLKLVSTQAVEPRSRLKITFSTRHVRP
jgi:hypothetical protein